jgi:hypothetical protein
MIQHLAVVGWGVHSRKGQEEVEQLEVGVLEAGYLVTQKLVHHYQGWGVVSVGPWERKLGMRINVGWGFEIGTGWYA